ncbi:uncharacterized protein TEOVI_000656500 [Trypanosoma equiperdum]|uniref:Uncharacterized protein n=2 Tax=Trypanozoon TaxID=39700 RepID=Q57YI1_TRYB2|nr:hypothetical protein, conserved [Trypanosoma brucei brucei TREU927]AAX69330.1 hypothetical protein, conserved [Trypanosoma brucei]AAZ13344.1 hypothetical protein, conserved [Trypanosoma brucei brucei TREU927]SCU65521.1 hypothetical protein, conserved [Trypanosoma equiperdum]
MKHKDARGGSTPYFAITNNKTGEVLLEVAGPLPPTAASPPPVEEECCGLFNDALIFITEVQTRSYDLFGRIVAKPTESHSTSSASAGAAKPRDRFMEAIIPEEATNSSVINSAEWEVDGEDDGVNDECDQFSTNSGDAGTGVDCNIFAVGPPPKRVKK